jgi:hypothetical protein
MLDSGCQPKTDAFLIAFFYPFDSHSGFAMINACEHLTSCGRPYMSNDDFEVEEGQEIVGRTIVGGRPAAHRKRKVRVPIGIEKVLVRAAADEAFRDGLLGRRKETLDNLGEDLTATERSVLSTIPDDSLNQMIANIDLRRHSRKRFMKGVLTAALITSAATATIIGNECCSTGATGDWPEDVGNPFEERVDVPTVDSAGARPDDVTEVEDVIKPDSQPADIIEVPDSPATKGIQPDTEEEP